MASNENQTQDFSHNNRSQPISQNVNPLTRVSMKVMHKYTLHYRIVPHLEREVFRFSQCDHTCEAEFWGHHPSESTHTGGRLQFHTCVVKVQVNDEHNLLIGDLGEWPVLFQYQFTVNQYMGMHHNHGT